MNIDRRSFTIALAAGCAPALAQAWPSRPLRIVVPSAAGGPWDPVARHLAERLGNALGQPAIVENKSGATGMIGMDMVAKAGDGHTLGVMFMPHALIPSLFRRVPYDLERDLVPLGQTHWTYNILVVNPAVGATDLKSLIAIARSRPGKLTYASGGNGSPAHVMGEYFKQLTGTFALHLPYRGPLPALQDLVGGQTDMMFASAAAAIPHIRSGRLKALAVTSAERLEAVPDVPTFAEAGYPKFDIRDWSGLVASPSVPKDAVPRIHAAMVKALSEPGLAARFAAMGIYLHTSTPQAFGAFVRSEARRLGEIVRKAGIQVE